MLLDIYLGLHSAVEGRPVGPEFVPYHFPDEESLYSYVIGVCGKCEFIDPQVKGTTEYNVCINKESSCYGITVRDGCIHFKPKYDEIKTWPAMK